MRNFRNYLLLPLTAIVLFSSCKSYHYMYAPVAPNTPMFNKKGESQVAAVYSGGSLFRTSQNTHNDGYDLQAGYALTNHFAITASFSHRREANVYDSTNSFPHSSNSSLLYHRNTALLGIGYFTPCNARGTSFFDLYAGYGPGRYELSDNGSVSGVPYHHYHNTSLSNFYVQPGFHFNPGENIQLALAARINTVYYYHISTDYTPALESTYDIASIRNTVFSFFEPSFIIRGGIPDAPWLRVQFDVSTSIKLNNRALYYRESYLTVGLSFDLSKMGAHDKKTKE